VVLAGGINLARDPRNGRNFEYVSEDSLLSEPIAGASITGVQQQGVISTIKHYSLNCNEANRNWLDAVIDPDTHRESDLLAFEIAIGGPQPGAAILQAWYPGQSGGHAIAEVLLGTVNPSGRPLITFPLDLSQTPPPGVPALGDPWGTPVAIRYTEGAEVGYRWFVAARP
jgi:hypothetical protein